MWIARIKVERKTSPTLALTRKHDVVLAIHNLHANYDGENTTVTRALVAQGKDAAKFVKEFKELKAGKLLHEEENIVYYEHRPGTAVMDEAVKDAFVLETVAKNGFEEWTVASWNKAPLQQIVYRVNKNRNASAKIVSLKKGPASPFLHEPLNKLSRRQREMVHAAAAQGYYGFPRRLSAEQLAGRLGRDESTVREHLRRAEQKIIEHVVSGV
ncbi:MAG: helix-turn-helix domain-containing protein [Candidatus Micrarchaeota archaeon]